MLLRVVGEVSIGESTRDYVKYVLNPSLLPRLSQVKAKGAMYVMLAVDAMMRKYPQEGTALLMDGGVFQSVLRCCGEVIRDGKNRGDALLVAKRQVGKALSSLPSQMFLPPPTQRPVQLVSLVAEPDVIIVQYMSIIARGIVANRDALIAGLWGDGSSAVAEGLCSPDELLRLFLNKFDSAGYGWGSSGRIRRRLWVCCLCLLLPPSPLGTLMLGQLDQLINVCLDVLAEEGGHTHDDGEIYYDSEEETVMGGFEEYERTLRSEIKSDPVMSVNVKAFIKAKLDEAVITVGAEVWREAEERCEPVLLKQLKTLLC